MEVTSFHLSSIFVKPKRTIAIQKNSVRFGAIAKLDSLSDDLQQRLLADPEFIKKSIAEVALAAVTQLVAEVGRRGKDRMLPEIDFVLAGLLTSVAGKYYSMWRVSPTSSSSSAAEKKQQSLSNWWERVPTNAFQDLCLDGSKPSLPLRLASFLKPIPALFRAGFISSLLGYGSTAAFIALRSLLLPSYSSQTKNVNVIAASVYTGCFLAIVSNVRYQLLSGVLEPKIIDRFVNSKAYPKLHAFAVFLVRLANGILGSYLAIAGMRRLGLQKLKS